MAAKKIFWGGFVDGKLDVTPVDMGWGGFGTGDIVQLPCIFRTKADAKKKYQDVRKLEVKELT